MTRFMQDPAEAITTATCAKGLRALWRDRDGAAAVEFAFILPILLLLMIGAIELGRGLHDFHVVNESVRDAAHYLSRVPVTCPVGGGLGSVDDLNDETRAKALAMRGSVDSSAPYLLGYWDNAGTIDITVPCIANAGAFAGLYGGESEVEVVELAANVPFTFMFGQFISPDANITLRISHKVVNVSRGLEP